MLWPFWRQNRHVGHKTTRPLEEGVLDFVALSDDAQLWKKVVFLGGGGRLFFFSARIADWYELIEINVLSSDHFVHQVLGENWQASSNEHLFLRACRQWHVLWVSLPRHQWGLESWNQWRIQRWGGRLETYLEGCPLAHLWRSEG